MCAAAVFAAAAAAQLAQATNLTHVPPMGWSSWNVRIPFSEFAVSLRLVVLSCHVQQVAATCSMLFAVTNASLQQQMDEISVTPLPFTAYRIDTES